MSEPLLTPSGTRPPDQPLDWGWLLRTLARWLLVLLAAYSVGWLLWRTGATLTPFIIGLVLAYLLRHCTVVSAPWPGSSAASL